jgi:hypothetical protein
MAALWPWAALAALGVFHGINPAMGWLFAVALGLHRRSRRVVLVSLLPIGLGHALAVLAVVIVVEAVGAMVDPVLVRRGAGVLLIGWATWHVARGHRHRVRVGMQASLLGLGTWSFLMATAHGAGLMLIPFVSPTSGDPARPHHHHYAGAADSVLQALAAVAVHSGAMLATTLVVALVVYDWLSVAVLRRTWLNLDLVWAVALAGVGVALLVT